MFLSLNSMLLNCSHKLPIHFIVISSLYISDKDFNIILLSYFEPLEKYKLIFLLFFICKLHSLQIKSNILFFSKNDRDEQFLIYFLLCFHLKYYLLKLLFQNVKINPLYL